MTLTAPRALLSAAFSLLLLVTACNRAPDQNAGDALVQPRQVSAAELRSAAGVDPAAQAFYEARNWRPAWTPATSAEFQQVLDGAWAHGISPDGFKAMITAQDPAGREAQLTRAALAYADALAHGLADPREIFEIYDMEMNEVDVGAGLGQALGARQIAGWLAGLPPRDQEYVALSEAYLRYRELAGQAQPPAIAEGELIRPGDDDPRVAQLAARLQAGGYLSAPAEQSSTTYGPTLVDAMKAFQNEQGISADGVVGDDTVAVLNAGPDDRARQLALNLEARRWLPRQVAPDRIDVNLPGAFLVWRRDGQEAERRAVVVGTPEDKTPHLAHPFSQLVVNPPWNVPQGIAEEEILPKGPAYLRARDMYVEDGRVVQRPGPEAALGLVKFDMQNEHAIYLHDTPSKDLFATNERYYSHGCVRVEGAVDFARRIAAAYGKGADFDSKLASGDTSVVELGAEIPVRLLYHTAFLDEDGRVAFRPDPYGWDQALAAALGIPAPFKRNVAAGGAVSLGP